MTRSSYTPQDFEQSQIKPGEVETLGPWAYLEIVRTRWWVTAVCVVGAMTIGVARVGLSPDLYTATTLVQKDRQRSPLDVFANDAGATIGPDVIASEVELLGSRSVLGPAVESLGLQLRISEDASWEIPGVGRVHLGPNALPGKYSLEPHGNTLRLVALPSGPVLASSSPGGVLRAAGLTIPSPSRFEALTPVEFEVLPYEDAVDELRAGLRVSTTRNTNLLRIAYSARNPESAADVVNAVAAAYRSQAAGNARQSAMRRREFLAEQVTDMADSVFIAQAALTRYQEASATLDPAAESQTLAGLLRAEEERVRRRRYQVGVLSSLLDALAADGAGDAPGLDRLAALGDELVPGSRELGQELRELQAERSRLTASRYGYREESSRVAVIDSLVAETRRDLTVLSNESLTLLNGELRESERRVRTLSAEAGAMPSRAAAISRLERRADALQATFQLLTDRYHEAQIAEAVAASDVAVIDAAVPPVRADTKPMVRPFLISLILGLMVGFFGSVALEVLSTKVSRLGDAESATQLQILGVLPHIKSQGARSRAAPVVVGGIGQALAPEADAFHALRTTLHYAWNETPRLIAVTSQGPREGKSFTATNLAMSMAHQGARVLLIDADLRRPRQHQIFNIERVNGLSDLLTRRADLQDTLRGIPGKRLWVIPAGEDTPDPVRLLSGDGFQRFLCQARDAFDYVIVDTPPVLAASELCSIAPLTDGVLIVARTNQTDRNALAHAVERLRRVRAPLLGVVLNGAPIGRGYRKYGGYYYRYYSYQEYQKSA